MPGVVLGTGASVIHAVTAQAKHITGGDGAPANSTTWRRVHMVHLIGLPFTPSVRCPIQHLRDQLPFSFLRTSDGKMTPSLKFTWRYLRTSEEKLQVASKFDSARSTMGYRLRLLPFKHDRSPIRPRTVGS